MRALAKRMLDLTGAIVLLAVAFPVLLCIALAVALESRGGVIFRQRRIGKDGDEFDVYKIRTMVANAQAMTNQLMAESSEGGWLKLDHDPRVTRVGRVLRHASLDEVPQLLNVIKGDMSLVGPRPLVPQEAARVPASAQLRATVRPGLTGLWQVSGRTSLSFEEMLELDCRYVRDWSLRTDYRLLIRTVPAVVFGRGVN